MHTIKSGLAVIAPGVVMEALAPRAHHIIIPKVLQDDARYAHYYANRDQIASNAFVLLDNGAFEAGVEGCPSLGISSIAQLIQVYRPTHVTVPDFIDEPAWNTLEHYKEWVKEVKQRVDEAHMPKWVYTAHGRSVEHYVHNAMMAIKHNLPLALPSICLRRHNPADHPENLRPRALELLRYALHHEYGAAFSIPWVHLFGAVSWGELCRAAYAARRFAACVTADTADPIKEAFAWSAKNCYRVELPWVTRLHSINVQIRRYEHAVLG